MLLLSRLITWLEKSCGRREKREERGEREREREREKREERREKREEKKEERREKREEETEVMFIKLIYKIQVVAYSEIINTMSAVTPKKYKSKKKGSYHALVLNSTAKIKICKNANH